MRFKRPNLLSLDDAVARIRTPSDAKAFLGVVLSPHEEAALRNRWAAFQMLLAGATQRAVKEELGVSIATASRAARALRHGAKVLRKLLDSRGK